jgi:predicted permease
MLTLGIGGSAAVFSLLNTLFFRSVPGVTDAQAVVFLSQNGAGSFPSFSYPNFRDVADRSQVFSDLAGYRFAPVGVRLNERVERAWCYLVTSNYFDALRVHPVVGDTFHGTARDWPPSSEPVAVISYQYWHRQFGGAPDAVGRVVRVNGLDYRVVGVAPQDFKGTELFFRPDLWVPLSMQPRIEGRESWLPHRKIRNLLVIGRLRPDTDWRRAEAELQAIAAQLVRDHPDDNRRFTIALSKPGLLGDLLRTPIMLSGFALLTVAMLILVIGWANLTALMLGRAAHLERDAAIRVACGATRGALARLVITENLIVAAAGGLAGLTLASLCVRWLATWRPPVDFPIDTSLTLDYRVIAFGIVLAMVTALAIGACQIRYATRADVLNAIRGGTPFGGQRTHRLRDALVAVQVTVAVVLTIAAFTIQDGLKDAINAELGFNPLPLSSVSLDLRLHGYDERRTRLFQDRLLTNLRTLEGIDDVALSSALPLTMNRSGTTVMLEGATEQPSRGSSASAFHYVVSPGYFETMQTPLLAGRLFTDSDSTGTELVAVVTKAFGDRFAGGRDAVGLRFRSSPTARWTRVVGVVANGKYGSLGEREQPVVFVPLAQVAAGEFTVIVRSRRAGEPPLTALRSAIGWLDPDVVPYDIASVPDQLQVALLPANVTSVALGVAGGIGSFLAVFGVFGLTSYTLARRTREFAIRMALGATFGEVFSLVIRRLALVCLTGLAAGITLAAMVVRALSLVTFGQARPPVPGTLIAVVGVAAAMTLAGSLAIRRLSALQPAQSLRIE